MVHGMASSDYVLAAERIRAERLAAVDIGADALDREPLGRRIATTIAREIILGRLPSGQALSQDSLCARFGTSRMPVRDALRELAAAGYLVQGVGNKLMVAMLTRQDIEDFFALEATLSGLLAQRAAERRTDEDIADLRALQEGMLRTLVSQDGGRMSILNRKFHELIHQIGRSSPLAAAYRNTTIHVAWNYYVEQPDRMQIGCDEHGRILAAIAAGDQRQAYEVMKRHIATAQEYRSVRASTNY
jgi:DNA-binding GntR family transcriptional regulator